MENTMKNYEDVDSWKTIMFLYNSALKEVGTKLEILNDEFQHVHKYNPIEHIKTRIKTPESIVKKLRRYGYEISIENMVKYINDIAGVRLICSFTSDIYRLAEMIGNQSDLKVLSIKDYIKNPKESGYKSYHMLVSVPIFLSDSVVDTKVEIQIRTIAMDFWASLEHKIYYKFEGDAPEYISRDLRECAEMVSTLDEKMLSLNEAIKECLEKQEELNVSTKTKETNRRLWHCCIDVRRVSVPHRKCGKTTRPCRMTHLQMTTFPQRAPSPQHSFQLHLTKSSISAISWPSADACSAICGRCASSPLCC